MAGLGQRLLGAALVGYGTGVVEQAKSRRQDTLLKLRRQYQVADREAAAALTREGWSRADARAADTRAASEALTREGWTRADERAEAGRAHDVAMFDRKLAAQAAVPPKPTSEQQNIAAFLQRNPGKTEADYFAMKRQPAVNIHPSDRPRDISAMFDPSTRMEPQKGYVFDFDPATKTIKRDEKGLPMEIPRGKTAAQAAEEAEKKASAEQRVRDRGELMRKSLDDVRAAIQDSPVPTTGLVGSVLNNIAGTPGYDTKALVDTLKSNLTLDTLKEMKNQSRTGATGFGALSERELKVIADDIANLDLNQSEEAVMRQLERAELHIMRMFAVPEGAEASPLEPAPLQPAPDVTLPPPEPAPEPTGPMSPTSALTPLRNGGKALTPSRATPEAPSAPPEAAPVVNGGARNGRNGGRKGPPQPEAPPQPEVQLSPDEAERVAMYADLPPDALQRQVETMAANPEKYSDAEKRAAAIAWERAFGGD